MKYYNLGFAEMSADDPVQGITLQGRCPTETGLSGCPDLHEGNLAADCSQDNAHETIQPQNAPGSPVTPSRRGTVESAATERYGKSMKEEICFDFTKGLCTRGDKCKFTHDLATIVSVNSREKGICFDYLRPSGCHRGLLCRFSHDLSSIAQQCAQSTHSSGAGGDGSKAGAKSSKAICFDFVKGVCERGPECRYSHDLTLIARTGRGGPQSQKTEVCHDFLRGRCERGSACKYSHSTALLANAASSSLRASTQAVSPFGRDFGPDGLPLGLLDAPLISLPGNSTPMSGTSNPLPCQPLFGSLGMGVVPPPPPPPALSTSPHIAPPVPFLPMQGMDGFEPSIPPHLQPPGLRRGALQRSQDADSMALAHSHAAVLHHLALLQQHNQQAAAAAASVSFPHLYASPPPAQHNPWASGAAAKAAPAGLQQQPSRLGENASPTPQLQQSPQQAEHAPLGALRDVSNTLHQQASAGARSALGQTLPLGASKANAGMGLCGAGAAKPLPAPLDGSNGRLSSCGSSTSGTSVVGVVRAASPPSALDKAGEDPAGRHALNSSRLPVAPFPTALGTRESLGRAWHGQPLPSPALGGSPLSPEAISAALASVGDDPHALATLLSRLAAAAQAQANSAPSTLSGLSLQQQLAEILGPVQDAEDDLLGMRDQDIFGPAAPGPQGGSFAASIGGPGSLSSDFGGHTLGGIEGGFPPSTLLPHPAHNLNSTVAAAAAGSGGAGDTLARLASDMLPKLQEIWNK